MIGVYQSGLRGAGVRAVNRTWGGGAALLGRRCFATTAAPSTEDAAKAAKAAAAAARRIGHRAQLANPKTCRRIVVKVGSAVVTRSDERGLAIGRLASLIEQVSQLHNDGREIVLVTSGAVAFGKQLMHHQNMMGRTLRQAMASSPQAASAAMPVDPRSCSAVGQGGLVALYDAMFQQYGVISAQVLVTKNDFQVPKTVGHLTDTINELLAMKVIPIVNENDAISPPGVLGADLDGVISVTDNDSLAANLAVKLEADAMVILSDVDGIYTAHPAKGGKLLDRFSADDDDVEFGQGSAVGRGGMEAKVGAAMWAYRKGVSVVIANGMRADTVTDVLAGKRVGTFFTNEPSSSVMVTRLARLARQGARGLQRAPGAQRARAIHRLAELLSEREAEVLAANALDLAAGGELSSVLRARLALTPAKLGALASGLRAIADSSCDVLGRVLRRTQLAEGLQMQQVTVPIGVLMVIFESRPDALPQVAALAMASGNGLILKGGKEAQHSNAALLALVREALGESGLPADAVALVSSREDVAELCELKDDIDLIIPRGSKELVASIKALSNGAIPVLGHADGICHVFVDEHADPRKAVDLVVDSKCDYPSACNAMETLLLHRALIGTPTADAVLSALHARGVRVNLGPRLFERFPLASRKADSLAVEYSDLECTVELVDDVEEAIAHIHRHGSSHTDAIVTEDANVARRFLDETDSACVFHNTSTRFADGFRLGLGAEVGISTGRIHARGPVGIEGLLSTKWKVAGDGHCAAHFAAGKDGAPPARSFLHKQLPLADEAGQAPPLLREADS